MGDQTQQQESEAPSAQEFAKNVTALLTTRLPISASKIQMLRKDATSKIGLKHFKANTFTLEAFIKNSPKEYKLPGLYVIDAILQYSHARLEKEMQNVYKNRFQRGVIALLGYVYGSVEGKDKTSVQKVVKAWITKGIYDAEILEPFTSKHPFNPEEITTKTETDKEVKTKTNAVSEKSSDKPAAKHNDKPKDKHVDKPTEKHVDKPLDHKGSKRQRDSPKPNQSPSIAPTPSIPATSMPQFSGLGSDLAAIVQNAYLAPAKQKVSEQPAFSRTPAKAEPKPILKKFDYGESDDDDAPAQDMSSLLGNLREPEVIPKKTVRIDVPNTNTAPGLTVESLLVDPSQLIPHAQRVVPRFDQFMKDIIARGGQFPTPPVLAQMIIDSLNPSANGRTHSPAIADLYSPFPKSDFSAPFSPNHTEQRGEDIATKASRILSTAKVPLRELRVRVVSRTVYLGGLADGTTREHVTASFSVPVESVTIPPARQNSAFVRFGSRDIAERILSEGPRVILDKQVKVAWGAGFGNRDIFDYQNGESVFSLADMNETEMMTLRLAGENCNLELLQDIVDGVIPIVEEPQYRKRQNTELNSFSSKRNKF